MKTALNRVGTWIVIHPRLMAVLVVGALAVAAFVLAPAAGFARPRWKP